MTGWDDVPVTAEHRDLLTGAAITAQVAAGAVRSVDRLGQLPVDFARYGADIVPGLLFTWHRVDGEPVVQVRPDEPVVLPDGERKYLFPPGTVPVLAVHPLMRDRVLDAAAPLVVVEGTKQYLAAVSALLDSEYAVLGVAGCYGWSHGGKPVPDLDVVPWSGRQVFVCFDADMATNREVWEAASALTEALGMRGAEDVRYVTVPGGRTAGLDDALGTVPAPAEAMRRLVDHASAKLPKRPARRKVWPDYFDEDGALLADRFAAVLRDKHPMALAGDHTVAVYSNGVYRTGPLVLTSVVGQALGDLFRPAHRASVEEYLTGALFAEGAVLPDRAGRAVLNVANGMLDLATGDLKPHSPAWMSAVQLPVAYDPAATCPVYEVWLAEQAGDQADDLEEVAATMLDPSRTPPKAIFLFGPSRSGKGTFLRLMKHIAGTANTSGVTLHQLSDDRFASANVHGKILNTAGDLSAEHVRDLSVFKMLTGEDLISANRKYGKQFTFTNHALFAFSANEIPTVAESSRAYFERVKPFRFARSFAGHEDPGVEKAMIDEELPGILTRWVRAWQRLAARGGYAQTDPVVLREFETESDRVHKWVREECRIITTLPPGGSAEHPGGRPHQPGDRSERPTGGTVDAAGGSSHEPPVAVSPGRVMPPGTATTKTDLYAAFVEWCTTAGMVRMNRKTFLGRLTSINGVTEVRLLPHKTRALNVILGPPGDHDPDDTETATTATDDSAGPRGGGGSFEPVNPRAREKPPDDHGQGVKGMGVSGVEPATTAPTELRTPDGPPAGETGYAAGLSPRLNVRLRPGDPIFGPPGRVVRPHLPGPAFDLLDDCLGCGQRLGERGADGIRTCPACGRRDGNRIPTPGETVSAYEPLKCACGRRIPVSRPGQPRTCPGCGTTHPTVPSDLAPSGEATLFEEGTP